MASFVDGISEEHRCGFRICQTGPTGGKNAKGLSKHYQVCDQWFGNYVFFQISNRTHWTDPKNWVYHI